MGNQNLLWISSTNEHPVIGQTMYRLQTMPDGSTRFEQIGQSWLKHGFTALTGNICDCGCNGDGGAVLGVGCSDPYSCGLNGSQSNLGPKFEVNAFTGYFEYPHFADGQTGNDIYKRLQVKISDLDPNQNGGGMYFVEGHYISPDDAAAGNQNNNASYRRATITNGSWNADVADQTVRERAVIRAWGDNVAGVVTADVQVPGDGVVIVGAEVTDLGGGMWHYEYAIQNMNSHRSVQSVTIPVGDCNDVSNIGFHDVDYHSGEPYDLTDWTVTCSGGAIVWRTTTFATDPNANALRWGTTYNFRFDAAIAPSSAALTMSLFRPGTPSSVTAVVPGPNAGPLDCNNNGVDDADDIANGTSQDCNGNFIPDECETWSTTPLSAVRVANGLTRPVFVCAPPGDSDRLFIVEQDGAIKILTDFGVLSTPFMDIDGLVGSSGNEQGLLSMAFHPDYASNGHFFVNYTNNSGDTVIARYNVSGDPNVADAGSALVLMTIPQDFTNHNGGQLQFGPDGYLYIGMGDGGSAGDPNNHAQDLDALLGKMLRLDVDAGAPYIPASNPFVGAAGLDEIWAYGLRNPWRFSFDRLTGDLYIGDVGQNAWEEVDFQPADSAGGENYGWRCYEGNNSYNTSGCDDPNTMVFPILEYDHSGGACSITGGYVYRGCTMPDLTGTYFYAEYCANWIRSFRYDGVSVTDQQDRTAELTPVTGAISQIVSFGEDGDGELYIVSHAGSVYKIVPQGTGSGICGDGVLDPGEECDDGNSDPNDGCYQCQLENNDDCFDAVPVTDGDWPFDTTAATTDGPSHSDCNVGSGNQAHNDVWFLYTATCDGILTASTCNQASYDTVLVVYDGGDCAGLSWAGCNDDTSGCSLTSEVSVPVFAGNSYLIRVGGYSSSSTGTGTLSLTNDGAPCTVCGNGIIEPGEDCDPPGPGCDENCHFIVCQSTIFADDFETDAGWSVENLGATSGDWERGVPVNDSGWAYDPAADSDGSGACYLTENATGNTDVDAGAVRLTSPAIDMSAGQVTISYDYYLYLTNQDGTDALVVEITDGVGGWAEVARHDTDGGLNWRSHTITQADLDNAGVTLTAATQVRFTANDTGTASIVEAGVDAFVVAASAWTATTTACRTTRTSSTARLWTSTATGFPMNAKRRATRSPAVGCTTRGGPTPA